MLPPSKKKTKEDIEELERETQKIRAGGYSFITGTDKPLDTLENQYDRLRSNYISYINRYGLEDYERLPVAETKDEKAIS